MKSFRIAIAACLAALAVGCASVGGVQPSPESQIATGANAVTATTTVATVALRNKAISVEQAKGFRAMLGAASTALDSANTALVACRKETGSKGGVEPDPCRPKVADLIVLALDSVANVRAKLPAK